MFSSPEFKSFIFSWLFLGIFIGLLMFVVFIPIATYDGRNSSICINNPIGESTCPGLFLDTYDVQVCSSSLGWGGLSANWIASDGCNVGLLQSSSHFIWEHWGSNQTVICDRNPFKMTYSGPVSCVGSATKLTSHTVWSFNSTSIWCSKLVFQVDSEGTLGEDCYGQVGN